MVDIIDGEIIKYDFTKNAHGGTELIADNIVKYVSKDLLQGYQIIHSRIRDLRSDKKKILWCHDLANDPEVKNLADPDFRNQFEKIVFVSNWQLQQYNMILGVPYSKSVVIQNAIEPISLKEEKIKDDTIRIIYHTTPHRGLNILVPVFEEIIKHIPNVHLDVYSSFKIYGWEERDKQYQELFDRCRNHPNITYHGTKSNEDVRLALKNSHIFAYPSIWPETSAISVIEAMYAGNVVVCPNYAALPETTGGMSMMYQWSENPNEHAQKFADTLYATIKWIDGNRQAYLNQQARSLHHYAHTRYNINNVKHQIEALLTKK